MTESERRMARALGCCTFVPGTATKRFAKSMAIWAQTEEETGTECRVLTPKQRKYLLDAVCRFRRQISPAIVAEAVKAKLLEGE